MNNNKSIIVLIVVAILIIGAVWLYSSDKNTEIPPTPVVIDYSVGTTTVATTTINKDIVKTTLAVSDNVSVVNGIQIITLQARGGYSPRRSVAQAGIPTVIRFNTSSTFDCSLSVRIPSINYSKILPQTGVTDVEIGSPSVGLFRGACGMGMYPFEINFK